MKMRLWISLQKMGILLVCVLSFARIAWSQEGRLPAGSEVQGASPAPASPPAQAQPPAVPGLEKIGKGVSVPVVLFVQQPKASPADAQHKVDGYVLIGIIIDEGGAATNVHVVRGLGFGRDEEALEAVKLYRFKPAMKNGKPVKVEMNVQVDFYSS